MENEINLIIDWIKNYHVHLIPRYSDDNWEMNYNQENLINTNEVLNRLTN